MRVRAVLGVLACFASGCKDDPKPPVPMPDMAVVKTFPAKFQLGTAIAGFQVDMGCPTIAASKCNDPNSDWYDWVTKPELKSDGLTYLSGDPIEMGPGFYELYEQDFDRVKNEMHANAVRLSIEWSRIFPTSTVGVTGYDALKQIASADGIDYYHKQFAAMKARGLHPLVTLNHYTLPTWIHDALSCHRDVMSCTKRGWIDRDPMVTEIAKYAGFAAQEFAGEVDDWATLNEPLAMLISAYIYLSPARTNPPGLLIATPEFKSSMVNMIEAHARMYDAVKAADTVDADGDGSKARVGIVYVMTASSPADPNNPLDVTGSKNYDYLLNRAFLGGIIKGDVDAKLDGTTVHHDELANRCDFLGLNYYQKSLITGTAGSGLQDLSPLLTFDIMKLADAGDYPQGLYEMLTEAKGFGIPIIITETGHEDGKDDGSSARWLTQTLSAVERGLKDGIDIQGYYYWTLMDLYEWNHGMQVKGGLYGMDGHDPQKTRHARSGVAAFREIADEGRVPPSLSDKYPLPQ